MKKLLIIILLFFSVSANAQVDEVDPLPFPDVPIKKARFQYMVFAGGISIDWLMLNEKNLNSFFNNQAESDYSFPSTMQLTGGHFVLGAPISASGSVVNFGVLSYDGSVKSNISTFKGTNIDGSPTGIDLEAQSSLSASMFGFSLHYGFIPFKHFAVLGGINTGWGDMTFEIYNAFDSDEFQTEYGMDRYEKDYFFVMPSIQLEYTLALAILLRADVSYNLTFGQDADWKYNYLGTNSINPDFNLSGFKFGLGIMIGLVEF